MLHLISQDIKASARRTLEAVVVGLVGMDLAGPPASPPGPGLAAIGWACAGQVPPLTARRLKESTLTRSRSTPSRTQLIQQDELELVEPQTRCLAVPECPPRHQKSIRITTRRSVGRLTSVKPASANTPTVPT